MQVLRRSRNQYKSHQPNRKKINNNKMLKTHVFIKINDSKKETNKGRKTVHFQLNTLKSLVRLRLVEEQWSRCTLLGMQQIESNKQHLFTITMRKSAKDMWHFCLVLHRWQRYTHLALQSYCWAYVLYLGFTGLVYWVSQGLGFEAGVFWSLYRGFFRRKESRDYKYDVKQRL